MITDPIVEQLSDGGHGGGPAPSSGMYKKECRVSGEATSGYWRLPSPTKARGTSGPPQTAATRRRYSPTSTSASTAITRTTRRREERRRPRGSGLPGLCLGRYEASLVVKLV